MVYLTTINNSDIIILLILSNISSFYDKRYFLVLTKEVERGYFEWKTLLFFIELVFKPFYFFIGGVRGLNLGPYIYYTLFLPTESNLCGLAFKPLITLSRFLQLKTHFLIFIMDGQDHT